VQLAGNEGGGPGSVRLASAAGRWVLAVAVPGEAMVLLEATVVNVALPSIGRDLHADVAGLQWTLDGYVLTPSALVLASCHHAARAACPSVSEPGAELGVEFSHAECLGRAIGWLGRLARGRSGGQSAP
jgi:hypothetical protein